MEFKILNQSKRDLLDLYSALSLAIAVIVFSVGYIDGHQTQLNISASLLIVGSFYTFCFGLGVPFVIKMQTDFSLFFLFQTICFMGLAYESKYIGAFYLAMIPALTGSYVFLVKQKGKLDDLRNKGAILLLLAMISFSFPFILQLKITGQFPNTNEKIIFGIYFVWIFSLYYFGSDFLHKEQKSIFRTIFKNIKGAKNKQVNESLSEEGQRMFFHDMINQTHGLRLFIESKREMGKTLTDRELDLVYKELNVFQTLIKDFFKLGHKNIEQYLDWIPFDIAQVIFKDSMNLIFNKEDYHFHLNIIGNEHIEHSENDHLINFSIYQRITTNLLKNVYDAGSTHGEFKIENSNDGLRIQIKNKITKLSEVSQDLDHELKDVILEQDNKDRNRSGVGFESINELCLKAKGTFEFRIENEFWVSEVFLPYQGKEKLSTRNVINKDAA